MPIIEQFNCGFILIPLVDQYAADGIKGVPEVLKRFSNSSFSYLTKANSLKLC